MWYYFNRPQTIVVVWLTNHQNSCGLAPKTTDNKQLRCACRVVPWEVWAPLDLLGHFLQELGPAQLNPQGSLSTRWLIAHRHGGSSPKDTRIVASLCCTIILNTQRPRPCTLKSHCQLRSYVRKAHPPLLACLCESTSLSKFPAEYFNIGICQRLCVRDTIPMKTDANAKCQGLYWIACNIDVSCPPTSGPPSPQHRWHAWHPRFSLWFNWYSTSCGNNKG